MKVGPYEVSATKYFDWAPTFMDLTISIDAQVTATQCALEDAAEVVKSSSKQFINTSSAQATSVVTQCVEEDLE